MADEKNFEFQIVKDYGSFGDGKWPKHLTLIKWAGRPACFDIRPWNEDMTKMGKGVTLTDSDLFDLLGLIEDALDSSKE